MLICAVLAAGLIIAWDWFSTCVVEPIMCSRFVDRIHRCISKKYRLRAEERDRREEEARRAAERFLWLCDHGY